jgi:hypothetical protein
VIAFTGDLGTADSLWASRSTTRSSSGTSSRSHTTGRLLVAMPAGFGVYNGTRPVDKELQC